jgi:hypothetical protein
VIMASHAEGIEAERLLPLARDGDHDRGPSFAPFRLL